MIDLLVEVHYNVWKGYGEFSQSDCPKVFLSDEMLRGNDNFSTPGSNASCLCVLALDNAHKLSNYNVYITFVSRNVAVGRHGLRTTQNCLANAARNTGFCE